MALIEVFFAVQVPELLPDELRRPEFDQTVHVVGEGSELGDWDPDRAVALTCTGGNVWMSPAVSLPPGGVVHYRYVLKRSNFIVDWETLEPARSVVLPFPPSSQLSNVSSLASLSSDSPSSAWTFVTPHAVYGKPDNFSSSAEASLPPLRSSQWLTDSLGSEVRMSFGTCKMHGDPIKMNQPGRENYTMRMKWGSASVDHLTTSGKHISSRLRRSPLPMEEGHESAEWTVFKFNARIPALQSASPGEASLLLEVLDGEKVVAAGFIPLTQFIRPNVRQGYKSARISRGSFTVPLLHNMSIVGEAFGDFLITDPFTHPNNNLKQVWGRHWMDQKEKKTLFVGHRGMGRSYRAKGGELQAIRENTILSFTRAGLSGAELVELDVMLTADRIPIVFHDFEIGIRVQKLRSASTRESKNIAVLVSHLTLAQLQSLVTTGISSAEFAAVPSFVQAELEELAQRETLQLNVPTLEELFKNLPPGLGLNVEIKYPINLHNEWLSFSAPFEINRYVDSILDVVFTHAHDRRVVFSCFAPDVCIALNLKQPRYPVCFLTEGGKSAEAYSDLRCTSLGAALAFAQSNGLSGVVTDSEVLFKDADFKDTDDVSKMVGKDFVQECRSAGLMLWTWGNANSHLDKVELQREWGCGAVICDNIDKVTKISTPMAVTPLLIPPQSLSIKPAKSASTQLDMLVYVSFSIAFVVLAVMVR